VDGWREAQWITFTVTKKGVGVWMLNGTVVSPAWKTASISISGFTPASNLLQLRRLALRAAQSADAPVAWLDASADTLQLLRQRYQRCKEASYWYEAPAFEYAATLEVEALGCVHDYRRLWQAER